MCVNSPRKEKKVKGKKRKKGGGEIIVGVEESVKL